jgi:hypothetical protein
VNLHAAIDQMEAMNSEQIHSSLGLPRVEPTAEQLNIWRSLEAHAATRGVRAFPSTPALVADFLNTLIDEELEDACQAIQSIHDSVGSSSPVATIAVRTILERRLRAESPKSWSRDDKQLFASLPVEIRAVLARRENERDAGLRRKQQEIHEPIRRLTEDLRRAEKELAEERKKLQATIPETPKEANDKAIQSE